MDTNTSVEEKFHTPQFAMTCGMDTRRTSLAWQSCLQIPEITNLYHIPLDLIKMEGHTATEVAEMTCVLLTWIGFSNDDKMNSINGNTSSAALAGNYIL